MASAGRDYLAACEMFARKKDATDADKPSAMIQGELFFRSEYGRMVTDGDPVVIMNAIRKRAGLEPIKDYKSE